MAVAYKTPGVYVEEIRKFPPSIAAVETAIPAFIGYTERAQKVSPGDLKNIPTKIGSLPEYELYFGAGAPPKVDKVTLDNSKNFKSASLSNRFFMYDSLRLFYANGGGDCYIVSVASYADAAKTAAEFTQTGKGIDALKKQDEPTIIVFPDNSLLGTEPDFYAVYDAALGQCGALMDRVGLFHVKETDPMGVAFRSGIGIRDLKYGMAYTPWLAVNFPKNIRYRDFKIAIYIGATNFNLADLTDDSLIKTLIEGYDQVIQDVDKISDASRALIAPSSPTLRDKFNELEGAYSSAKTIPNFQSLINFMFAVARKVDQLIGSSTTEAISNTALKSSIEGLVTSTLKATYATLIGYDRELEAESDYTAQYSLVPTPASVIWGGIFGTTRPAPSNEIPVGVTDFAAQVDLLLPRLKTLFEQINDAWLSGVVDASQNVETQKHQGLLEVFPLYKNILTGLQNTNTTVPPSGAVAGIYAYVDRTRGVWKAPANVSISGVVGPSDAFAASELDALNVDPNSGKSINAIRAFTGKGTLVFGARTLAGNDNEWRYVNVRRFFNFIEQSTKKTTEQFVFEPNDANTWMLVQAMIENFLTVVWRQGALQGIKPEHAFYVATGLGKTMTPLDVLEGRMIVEIGLAVVRPAEFIILRFSHKMAES